MRITAIHPDFIMPSKGSIGAGAFDVYMPIGGIANGNSQLIGLGFAAAVPTGYVALLLPRSSSGAKFGLALNNTCGVIDSDYRGEWMASIKTNSGIPYAWNAGDRLLQFILVPVATITLEQVDNLEETGRGLGGFGSTGN
jgi:dUTP pyrophosphatase